MITDYSQNDISSDNLFTQDQPWQPYSDEEYIATYVKLPRFVKEFRGKFQQIFGRRIYAFSRFTMTIGEVIVFIGCVVIMGGNIYQCYGQEKPSGNAASLPLLACLLFTVKNSILGYLVGISYERGIFWHKFFGASAVAGGVIHLVSSTKVIDGWLVLGSMCSMVTFGFWPIRIFLHSVFMKLHWLGFLVFIVGSIWHGVTLGIIGAGYWGADFLVKLLIIRRHRQNSAEIELSKISKDIVRLSVPNKTIPFSGGQFVFICIPKISYFEWHPFSIQSSFKEGRIDFYVKAVGGWTKDLLALVNESTDRQVDSVVKTKVYLSGPYGFPSIDLESDRYKSFLLVGGGIGLTPIVSTCKQLMEQRKQGRPITKIILLWTTRDLTIAEQVLSIQYLESLVSSADRMSGVLEVYCHCSTADAEKNSSAGASARNKESIMKVIPKRPDVNEYLKQIVEITEKNGEKRAAVMVCGPYELITDVQTKAVSNSSSNVRLDVHEEVFAM